VVGRQVTLGVSTKTGQQPTDGQWTFGDGSTGNGVNVRHTWQSIGTFQVSVDATFPDGQVVRAFTQVSVRGLRTVTVSASVSGDGFIRMGPSGSPLCPPTCSRDFTEGTVVKLLAIEGNLTNLDSWGGACAGSNDTCNLTVPADPVQVSASYSPGVDLALTSQRSDIPGDAGVGGGRIDVSDGRSCVVCVLQYPANITITIKAVPNAGFHFTGWEGFCSQAGLGPCSIFLDFDPDQIAFFTPDGQIAPNAVPPPQRPSARRRRAWRPAS
jgi:hypothetical protein